MNEYPMNNDPLYYHTRCEMRLPKDVINSEIKRIKQLESIEELHHIEVCEDNQHNTIDIEIDLPTYIGEQFNFDEYIVYQYGNRSLKKEESLYYTIKGGEDRKKKSDLAYILVNKNTYESIFLLGEIKHSLTIEQFFKARRQIISTLTDLFIIHSLLQIYPKNVSVKCIIFTKNDNKIPKSQHNKAINTQVYRDEKGKTIPIDFVIHEYINKKIFCGIDRHQEMKNFDVKVMAKLPEIVLKPLAFDIIILE